MSLSNAQQLPLKSYTRALGLASDYVLALYQDRQGYIWAGTDRGVSVYDGKTFRTFTTADGLPSNLVYCVFQAMDGAMWFGTYEGGAARFDGQSWTVYSTRNGLAGDEVRQIVQDKYGRMYFGTTAGLSLLTDSGFVHHPVDSLPYRFPLGVLRDGNILFSNVSTLFRVRPSPDNALHIDEIPLGPHRARSASQSFYESADGRIYLPGARGAIELTPEPRGTGLYHIEPRKGWLCEEAIVEGPDSTLWLASRFGLQRVRNGVLSNYHIRQGIEPSFVHSLLVDREGNLWLGTFGGGIKRLLGDHLSYYDARDGLISNNINVVFQLSPDSIFFGMNEGLMAVLGDTLVQVRRRELREVRTMGIRAGRQVVIGTFTVLAGPISAHDLLKGGNLPLQRRATGYASTYQSPTGEQWVGGYGEGLLRYTKGGVQQYTMQDGLCSDMIEAIVPGLDGIWFLSRNNGVSYFRQEHWRNFGPEDGLPSRSMFCGYEESDTVMWLGTDKGLARLTPRGVTTIGPGEGLLGTTVVGIYPVEPPSPQGRYWVVTEKALHLLEGGRLTPFGSVPLVPSADASINTIHRVEGENVLWLATTHGAVRLDLARIRRVEIPPQIVLTHVLQDTTLLYDGSFVGQRSPEVVRVQLPHTRNNLTFGFAALSYVNEERVRYQFRLAGVERDWSPAALEREVHYRNLGHGEYTFEVIAINPEGIAAERPAQFSFTILAPFWLQWWFVGGAVLALMMVVVGGVRYLSYRKLQRRVRELEQERRLQEERQRTRDSIARDLHDDLASTVGSAGFFIESVKRQSPEMPHQVQEFLRKASSLLSEAEQTMSDIIWSVAPRHDTLESLLVRMRTYTLETCKAHGIRPVVQIPELGREESLSGEIRKNIFLVLKETLRNVFRHADATTVQVVVRLEEGIFEMVISDNGRGFTPEGEAGSAARGHGLANLQRRAEEIKGRFTIRSKPAAGTTVGFEVRLTQTGH